MHEEIRGPSSVSERKERNVKNWEEAIVPSLARHMSGEVEEKFQAE